MPYTRTHGRYCVRMIKLVFFTADTITVRLLLAWASIVYAMLLVYPVISHGQSLFERPAYALMAIVPGSEWTWAALFLAHGLGVHWRALDPVERVNWGLFVNSLGVFTWTYSTLSLNVALGAVLPGTALEWIMVFSSSWALWRTGLTRELVSA